jgi:hypothetical protein
VRRSLILVVMALLGSAAACAPTEDDVTEPEASEDALASFEVRDHAAITPPEHRVATARIASLLGPAIESGHRVAFIRSLTFQNKRARLAIDDDTLQSSLVAEDTLASATRAANATDAITNAPYPKSLADSDASNRALTSVDADARIAPATTEPFALTIDMCQSRRAWDKRLFEWAVNLSTRIAKPVPIGVAMTGGWAKAHPAELEQITAWERAGKLAITWINHSSTHPLHCLDDACRRAEFLTNASVDFDEEVFGLERTLLARGIVPSPIFRFPGLIHDQRRLDELARLSLLPLDADGWIAKGQGIKSRAVVLVHGNGNEPEGINGFFRQVEDPARAAALGSGKSALVSPLLVAPSPPR